MRNEHQEEGPPGHPGAHPTGGDFAFPVCIFYLLSETCRAFIIRKSCLKVMINHMHSGMYCWWRKRYISWWEKTGISVDTTHTRRCGCLMVFEMVKLHGKKSWNVSSYIYENKCKIKKVECYRNGSSSGRTAEVDSNLILRWQDMEPRGNPTRLQEASDQGKYYALRYLARNPAGP